MPSPPAIMRIALDLQACQGGSAVRGIGRYSLSLAKAMAAELTSRGHEVSILLSGAFPDSIEQLALEFALWVPKHRVVVFPVVSPCRGDRPDNLWRRRATEIVRETLIGAMELDLVHVSTLVADGWSDEVVASVGTGISRCAVAATFYDAIPLVMREVYLTDPAYCKYYERQANFFRQCELLLAISDFSAAECQRVFGVSQDSVVNVSAAVDEMFTPGFVSASRQDELRARYGIDKPYVMYAPGGFDYRKNIKRLFSAYGRLPRAVRSTHQLVIASKLDTGQREAFTWLASECGMAQSELVLTDYLPDADLIDLYRNCSLFVFASFYEGFGLPLLEAMACGAPVVGARAASIPEVIGRDDALFDPMSEDEMADRILAGLTQTEFRESLVEHGLRRTGRFSWLHSAIVAVDAIERNSVRISKRTSELQRPLPAGAALLSELIRQRLASETGLPEPGPDDLAQIDQCATVLFNISRCRDALEGASTRQVGSLP